MNTATITLHYTICQWDELSVQDRRLVEAAREATLQSYAPYSHFHVGAAVALNNGKIVTGSNQENAAYPSGLCAERTALFAAQHQYPEAAVCSIALTARNAQGWLSHPLSPCGACRQVMVETEQRSQQPLRILLVGSNEIYLIEGIKQLLPFLFTEESLR